MNVSNISELVVGNSTKSPYEYLYGELCKYYLIWYVPITIVVGVMGTLFSLFFLFCSKLFQSSMLLWLSSICIGDFFILVLEGVWILLKVWFGYDVRDQNDVICKIHKFSSNYAFYWSAYMQSALSIQRAYLIFRPLHARSRGGISKRHIIAWTIISLILIIPVSPYFFYWKLINGDCDPFEDIFHVMTLCDLIIWGIIPLLIMIISTIMICLNMAKLSKKFKRRRMKNTSWKRKISVLTSPGAIDIVPRLNLTSPPKRFTRSKSTTTTQGLSVGILDQLQMSECIQNEPPSSQSHPSLPKLKRQLTDQSSVRHNAPDNFGHVTRLLVCMNITYMASTFPLLTYLMFRNFSSRRFVIDQHLHRFCYYLFRSFCFLNSCTNWIFYCLVGKLFRDEAKHIILMCLGLEGKEPKRNLSNHSGKLPVPNMPILRTPVVSQQNSPVKRMRSVSAVDLRRAVSKIPLR
nr:Orphan Rhodopsin-like G protein-coupled receptor [Hymenolepis microstoma]